MLIPDAATFPNPGSFMRFRAIWDRIKPLLPGLAAVAVVTGAAVVVATTVGGPGALAWALVIGLAVGPQLRDRIDGTPGTGFASKRMLRVGVALLGLSISAGQALALGPSGLLIAAGAITFTLTGTILLARRFAVDRDLALLIGVGTSICGASAIAAAAATTDVRQSQVGYALATVTVFGTVAMLGFPVIAPAIGLGESAAGVWFGASIHEVAQVTAAGAAVSGVALKTATLVKLIRVTMLAAVLIAIRWLYPPAPAQQAADTQEADILPAGPDIATSATSDDAQADAAEVKTVKPPLLPAFIIAFLVLMMVRTLIPVPVPVLDGANEVSRLLQTAALAGIGLQVNLVDFKNEGMRPILLGLAASVLVAAVALAGVLAIG